MAFEKMEALRSLDYLKDGGTLVVNNEEIPSQSVVIGEEAYPADVLEEIRRHVDQVKVVDASGMAQKLGNEKAANMVLLGTIIHAMGLEQIHWDAILKDNIKPKFLELNQKAIQMGMGAVRE